MTATHKTETTETVEPDPRERIVLSERDLIRFVDLIENPEPPTQELREAMAEYRRLQPAYSNANL